MKKIFLILLLTSSFFLKSEDLLGRPFSFEGHLIDAYLIAPEGLTFDEMCLSIIDCKNFSLIRDINEKDEISLGDIIYFPSSLLLSHLQTLDLKKESRIKFKYLPNYK